MLKIKLHSNLFFSTAGATLLLSSFTSTILLNEAIKVDIFSSIFNQSLAVFPFVFLFIYSACLIGKQISEEKTRIPLKRILNAKFAVVAAIGGIIFVAATLLKNGGLLLWPSPMPISMSLYLLIVFISYLSHKMDTCSAAVNACAMIAFYIAANGIYLHVIDEWANMGLTAFFFFFLSAIKFEHNSAPG